MPATELIYNKHSRLLVDARQPPAAYHGWLSRLGERPREACVMQGEMTCMRCSGAGGTGPAAAAPATCREMSGSVGLLVFAHRAVDLGEDAQHLGVALGDVDQPVRNAGIKVEAVARLEVVGRVGVLEIG